MKRSKLFLILGSLCLALVIAALPFMAACAAPEPTPVPTPTPTPTPVPTPAPEKVIEFKHSSFYPILHPVHYDCYLQWCKELDKRTDGRTKTTIFPGGSLATQKEQYEAVKSGMADLANISPMSCPGVFVLNEIFHLPFWAPDAAIASMAGYRQITEHEEILNEWEIRGIHFLAMHTSAAMHLHTTAKAGLVKDMGDIKGLILGADTPEQVEWLNKIGAAATRIETQHAYLALEKGVLYGGIWPFAPLRSLKITEYAVNHTVMGLNFATNNISMNQEKWQSLPSDIQKIINDISGMALSAWAGYTLVNGSAVDVQWMKDQGHEFHTLPPDEKMRWVALVEYSIKNWQDSVTQKGTTKRAAQLWEDLNKIVADVSANPYPEQEWWGPDAVGRYGSPNRPGGWD